MDLTIATNVADAIAIIEQQKGGVDLLVNNGGFGSSGRWRDTKDAKYQFDVNVFGLARITKTSCHSACSSRRQRRPVPSSGLRPPSPAYVKR